MTTVERIAVLRDAYGPEVELVGDGGGTEPHRIAAEFRLGGQAYAGLQTDSMRRADEVAFFRIAVRDGGDPELESIEDEDEWEAVAEAYDDLMFVGDERP